MTPDDWDVHWHRIREDILDSGRITAANLLADTETTEQFGPRPQPDQPATGRSGGRAISGGAS